MSRRLATWVTFGLVAAASTLTWASTAGALPGSNGPDARISLAAIEASAATCGETVVADPVDAAGLDAASGLVGYSCETQTWTIGVTTHADWADAGLGSFVARLDTDGSHSTGCVGTDYRIVAQPSTTGQLTAALQATPDCAPASAVEQGAVQVDRLGLGNYVGVEVEATRVGSPAFITFDLAINAPGAAPDRVPDGGEQAHVSRTNGQAPVPDPTAGPEPTTDPGGPDPQPIPAARAIDDSCPAGVPPAGFRDVSGDHPHAAGIDCIAWWKVTSGTSATEYSPAASVTRAQMATFIANMLRESGKELPASDTDFFPDDTGSFHEDNINRLRAAGVIRGRTDGTYGPNDTVNRDAMATFLIAATEYRTGAQLGVGADYFRDDNGNTHEPNINKAAAVGITAGTADGGYRPSVPVRRDQMASFIARVLDLTVEGGYAVVPAR